MNKTLKRIAWNNGTPLLYADLINEVQEELLVYDLLKLPDKDYEAGLIGCHVPQYLTATKKVLSISDLIEAGNEWIRKNRPAKEFKLKDVAWSEGKPVLPAEAIVEALYNCPPLEEVIINCFVEYVIGYYYVIGKDWSPQDCAADYLVVAGDDWIKENQPKEAM